VFGGGDQLALYLLAAGLAAAVLAGVITWGVARRYGRRRALLVPMLAMIATLLAIWRANAMGTADAMAISAAAFIFGGPAVAGALLGLTVSGKPKG
jgi:Na+/alanine symporter